MGKKSDQNNSGAADPWKSKAVQKLYNVVQKVFDLKTPDDRLIASARAKAEVKKIEAQNQVEVEAIKLLAKAETAAKAKIVEVRGELAARALNRMEGDTIRQQQNIEAIITEAYVALPPPAQQISDEPVSEDFVHRFFDDCKNISGEQMRTVWGRLLAGEITQPGTYHPRTLAVLKDMMKEDATKFVDICKFCVNITGLVPIIFECEAEIYNKNGVDFTTLLHLNYLGLINIEAVSGYRVGPANIIIYRSRVFTTNTVHRGSIDGGKVVFSPAGHQLSRLVDAPMVPEFWDYAVAHWKKRGVIITPDENGIAAPSSPQ